MNMRTKAKKNQLRLNRYTDTDIVEDTSVIGKEKSEKKIIFNEPPQMVGSSEIWTYEQFKLNVLRIVSSDLLNEKGIDGQEKNSLTYLASFIERFLREAIESSFETRRGARTVRSTEANHLRELLILMESKLEKHQPTFWSKISSLIFFNNSKICDKCGSFNKGSFDFKLFLKRQMENQGEDTKGQPLFNDWLKKPSENVEVKQMEIRTRHRLCEMSSEHGMNYTKVWCTVDSDGKWTCEYEYPHKTVKVKEGEDSTVTFKKVSPTKNNLSKNVQDFAFDKRNKKIGVKRGYAYDGLSLEEALKHSTPIPRQKDKVRCNDCKGTFAKRYFYSHYRKHIS